MQPRLQLVEAGVAPGLFDQFVVGAVLDQSAALDRDDAVGMTHRGQAMGDDQDGAPVAILRMLRWMMFSLS